MATIQLTVVTPEGKPYEGEVERVIVRSTGGDVCVMARHIDYMTALGDGDGRVNLPGGEVRHMHIKGGMLEFSNESARIITNSFAWKE